MNHIVETIGVLSAVIIWGGLSAMFLRRQIKRQLVALARHARTTPFRTLLGAVAVGIAIAYGGTKPGPVATTVRFEPMGGEGAFGPCWFPAGVSTNLPSCTLTKPGYAFVGWAQMPNGALSYKDGGKLDTPAEDTQMTLYAIWVKSGCYGLAFDPGVEGASWSMVYQHVATNAVDKINACEYSHPDGKSFAGWAKTEIDGEPAADPRRYDDGVLIFNLAAEKALVVLRAIWQ